MTSVLKELGSTMSNPGLNKYRAALRVLQEGRDRFADELADTVLERCDDLLESSFLLTELVESQGSRLHYMAMLMAQLEQAAEDHDAAENRLREPSSAVDDELSAPPAAGLRRRTRVRKRRKLPPEQSSAEGQHDQER
jgi:hypothetical protein